MAQVFKNELTLEGFTATGKADDFHARYEEAYEKTVRDLGKSFPNVVGGKERRSSQGEFSDLCPYDKKLTIARFQKGTTKDVADAVRIASDAFEDWQRTRVKDRCDLMRRAASHLRDSKFALAAMLTLEIGKTRFEAMAEVDEAIDYLRYYSQLLETSDGYTLELGGRVPCNETASVLRPLGVIGVIAPFNFPLAITAGMTTGALITGNTVVLKPPSDAPLVGRMLYDALIEAGLPPETLHYVAGPGDSVGAEISSNAGITAIAFTGSREVGLHLMRVSVERGKRPPIIEMGGKNAAIVTEKADLDKAVTGVGKGAFGYSGQKCSATSRVIVIRAVADQFTERLVKWIKSQKIGDPSKQESFMGPVINQAAVDRFRKVMAVASKDGKILTGGRILENGAYADGFFVEPTVITHLARNHDLALKELFLPVLVVLKCGDLKEAIEISNSVEYGLTGGIYSEDPGEIDSYFSGARAGVLYANRSTGATTGALVGSQPFVGWKSSGVTGKGAGGPYYLLQFLQEQSRTVCR